MTNKDMETKNDTIEFIKWCYAPVHRKSNNLGSWLRVAPQFPDYDSFIIIGDTGKSILPDGTFLTAGELYEYWLNNK